MSERALDGTRVVEYAEMVSGPYCARLLGNLGAEVIKVEEPGTGDKARQHVRPPPSIARRRFWGRTIDTCLGSSWG